MRKDKKKDELKQEFLDLYKQHFGNVSVCCDQMKINRTTYYYWLKKDKDFASSVEDLNESLIDHAETVLHNQIAEGNTAALLFFLKCKAKDRGYIENPMHQDVNIRITIDNESIDRRLAEIEESKKARDSLAVLGSVIDPPKLPE